VPTNPNAFGALVARRLVAERYPQARAAWLGGSVASGQATENSDLDITVLLDGAPAPIRRSETVDGWPVEWFVQTEESLLRFCDEDRLRRRRPTTMRLVGSSTVLADADGSGVRLQRQLHAMDRRGPPPVPPSKLEDYRYAVTDLLADLIGARDPDERLTVAAALVSAAADLLLAVNRRWSGSGKWLMRELALLDDAQSTTHGTELVGGLRAAAAGDPVALQRSVVRVLAASGGPVFDGYHRGAPAPEQVDVRAGAVDEPGIADLISYAVGENGRRLEDTVRSYRDDPAVALLVATVDAEPVGVLGYRSTDTEITLLHLATAPDRRRSGLGRRLVDAVRAGAPRLPLVAETDRAAVGFYAATGFVVTSLGEKYPGVERFLATLPALANTDPWPTWASETVELVEPDSEWQSRGRRLGDAVDALLAPWLTAPVEHVGSTAVPGLAAKPIVDLQAAVADLDAADEMAAVLGPHEWHFVAPDLDRRPWRRFFVKVVDGRRVAHLHVMTLDCPRWHQQIAFRDALRARPTLAADYAALKRVLAERHRDDREAYGAAKHSFIHAVLDATTD